jgi:hypothetical protein
MRRLTTAALLALAAASLIGDSRGGAAQPQQLVFVRSGDLWSAAPDGSEPNRLTRSSVAESAPALSPDGRFLAFVSDRSGEPEIVRARLPEWTTLTLSRNPGRADVAPAWAPDGKRLAWSSEGDVYVMNAVGNERLAVAKTAAAETEPSWSPDGTRIVYAAGGDLWVVRPGGDPVQLTGGPEVDSQPDWSRSGVLFVRDGRVARVGASGGAVTILTAGPTDASPAWSPDGSQFAFAHLSSEGSTVLVYAADGRGVAQVLDNASEPDWALVAPAPPPPPPPPRPRPNPPNELLPDLDQRAPSGLVVTASRGRYKLGFVSAVDNIGRGPVWLVASRPSTAVPVMRVAQRVLLDGGGYRAYRGAGILRYTYSPEHSHWHYQRFERYELRRSGDFAVVARDHKTGFCLADHYGYAASRVGIKNPKPRFLGSCEKGNTRALFVEQGSSVGFTDRYPANYHGQNVEITGLPAGTYWLVHVANPFGGIRELTRANDKASVLIRLSWPHGHGHTPVVDTLRICEAAERCSAPTVP